MWPWDTCTIYITVKLLNFQTPEKFTVIIYPQISTMWLYHGIMSPKYTDKIANSVDRDQTAPRGAVWSGSTLFPLGAVWSGSTLFAQPYLSENLGTLRYHVYILINAAKLWYFIKVVVFVFYGLSTLFRSFQARSVILSTLFLGKPPRQFTST